MKKILKMSDISILEAKRLLSFVRYVSLLEPILKETQEGVILTCNVDEENRFVFAEVFRALAEFVYTDTDQTAFERVCELAEVRALKFAFVEQGTRGQVCATLLETSEQFDQYVETGMLFATKKQMEANFACELVDICKIVQNQTQADVVVVTQADFQENPLVPTVCEIAIRAFENTSLARYQLLGTKKQVAKDLCFLTACFLAKKIF